MPRKNPQYRFLTPEARAARAASAKAWRERNPGKVKDYNANRDLRSENLKRVYGMTRADYDEMFEEQGGVCLICLNPSTSGESLDVDHDHATGEVRGLLCRKCNVVLGLVGEDVDTLCQAVWYLEGGFREMQEKRILVPGSLAVDTPGVVS